MPARFNQMELTLPVPVGDLEVTSVWDRRVGPGELILRKSNEI